METSIPKRFEWQDLFQTNSPTRTEVDWRVLRKNGEPLLILPASNRAAVQSLELYPAQTFKARLAKTLLRMSLQSGWPLPMEKTKVVIDPASALTRFLVQHSGTKKFPPVAILAGNPRTSGRRFILLLFGEQNVPARVVKVGMGEAAKQLIQREADFLESLTAPGVPKILGRFHDANLEGFAMDFFDGQSPAIADTDTVTSLIETWVDENSSIKFGEIPAWQELRPALSKSPWQWILEKTREVSVRKTIWHGDLAPWNVKLNRAGKCVVLDWERGQPAGVPGWDWFHFVIQSGVLVKKFSATKLRHETEAMLRSEKFSAYARRSGIAGIERELVLAYLLYHLEIINPSEGAATIRSLLELLTESWKRDLKF